MSWLVVQWHQRNDRRCLSSWPSTWGNAAKPTCSRPFLVALAGWADSQSRLDVRISGLWWRGVCYKVTCNRADAPSPQDAAQAKAQMGPISLAWVTSGRASETIGYHHVLGEEGGSTLVKCRFSV